MSIFSLFSQSLVKEDYVFFDVETTGLYPLAGDRVIEIAMIKTSKGNIVDTIEAMINPNMPIPPQATAANNITDDMIKDSPYFNKELAEKITNFIENCILIAHNAAFDLGFLSVELGRLGITFDRWLAIDTLKIAVEIFPGQRNKLENIMRRYNILPEGELHRALIDTDALRRIFFEFLEESEIRSNTIEQLIKKYGFQGQNVHRSIPARIREAIVEKKIIKGNYQKRNGKITELSVLPISPVWVNKKWYLLAEEEKSKNVVSLNCENFIDFRE
ncbi:MAG: hypothetical protein KAT05_07370 [Spirochaetes bacterium]|nr:hypothetical protein [Spirochaetota bacterium]